MQNLPTGKIPEDINKYMNIGDFLKYIDYIYLNNNILFKIPGNRYRIMANSNIANFNGTNGYYFSQNNKLNKILDKDLPIENCLHISCSKLDKDSSVVEELSLIFKIRSAS